MICNSVLSHLGYDCQPLSSGLVRINTPFFQDDGDVIGVYIEQLGDDKFLITDDAKTLMNLESRGVSISTKRFNYIKQNLSYRGIELNQRAEINSVSNSVTLAQQLQKVIQGSIITGGMALDWFSLPEDKFEKEVKGLFRQKKDDFSQQLTFDNKFTGLSGHIVNVPILLQGSNKPNKQIFTVSVKAQGNWNSAYSVLGKMTDLTDPTSNAQNTQQFVIIDDHNVGDQFNNLVLLFNAQAQVLPYQKQNIWLNKLAA
ncbi:DUF1828 domain-containing protein [Lonepinella sp. BR2474]|uniref:DUF1828 domain-containing protein n=1 Tax=Lonepinella sp. BR2474 TaxID=3434548 RepID=UPI003F6E2C2F